MPGILRSFWSLAMTLSFSFRVDFKRWQSESDVNLAASLQGWNCITGITSLSVSFLFSSISNVALDIIRFRLLYIKSIWSWKSFTSFSRKCRHPRVTKNVHRVFKREEISLLSCRSWSYIAQDSLSKYSDASSNSIKSIIADRFAVSCLSQYPYNIF